MADKSQEAKETLDRFFQDLKELGKWYHHWTGDNPKNLVINPDIIGKLSRIEGFYQRPELTTEVTAHSPIVRYFNLDFGIVTIVEDWEENFLHFE